MNEACCFGVKRSIRAGEVEAVAAAAARGEAVVAEIGVTEVGQKKGRELGCRAARGPAERT